MPSSRTAAFLLAFLASPFLLGQPVAGAPYSADGVTESTQTLADGNRIVHSSTVKLYRDSQGRERREDSNAIFLSDPVSQTSYILTPQKRTATKMRLGAVPGNTIQIQTGKAVQGTLIDLNDHRMASGGISATGLMILPGAPKPASKVEQLGSQTIEGVLANGTRTTITILAGQIGNDQPIQVVDEIWYSPELQVNVLTRHNDPRTGESVYRLTNIHRAEPDPLLFQVPPDYTVTDAPAAPEIRIIQKQPQ